MSFSEVSFTVPTTNTDGTPITVPLTYTVNIDTVNPPVHTYSVPAADVSAAVGGVVTATFAQLGFTPVSGTTYYAAGYADEGTQKSAESNVVTFTYYSTPNAPTGFTVA